MVAGLLAVAALALDGRRGLDWDRLVGVPDVAWAQLLLAGIGAALVVLVIRRLIRVWRTLRPRLPEDEEAPEGIPMPWPLWVLAGTVVVVAMAACYWVLRLVLDRVGGGDAEMPEAPDSSPLPAAAGDVLPLLLVLLAVVAAAAVAARVLRSRVDAEVADDLDEPVDGAVLAGAVAAASDALDRYDDDRAAIIAAYRAMADVLRREAGRPSDTATELLDRAVAGGLVTRAAAAELTELFREARFSRHPIGPAARAAAERALARVSAELGARA